MIYHARCFAAALVLVACAPRDSGSKSAEHPHASAGPTASAVTPLSTAPAVLRAGECTEKGALRAELTTSPKFDSVGHTRDSLYGIVGRDPVNAQVYILQGHEWIPHAELTPTVTSDVFVRRILYDRGEFHWIGEMCSDNDCNRRHSVAYRFHEGSWLPEWSPTWGTPYAPHYPPKPGSPEPWPITKSMRLGTGEMIGQGPFAHRAIDELVIIGSGRRPAIPKHVVEGCNEPFGFEGLHDDSAGEDRAWVLARTCSKLVLVEWSEKFSQAKAFALPLHLDNPQLSHAGGMARIVGRTRDHVVHFLLFDGKEFVDHKLSFAYVHRIPKAGTTNATVFEIEGAEAGSPAPTLQVVHRVRGPGNIQMIPMPSYPATIEDSRGGVWAWDPSKPDSVCWLGASSDVPVRVELPVTSAGVHVTVHRIAVLPDGTAHLWGHAGGETNIALKVKAP